MRVTNGIPLGCSLLLPVDTVNSVQTLKAAEVGMTAALLFMICALTDPTNKAIPEGAAPALIGGTVYGACFEPNFDFFRVLLKPTYVSFQTYVGSTRAVQ
jgi:hypothetical protein